MGCETTCTRPDALHTAQSAEIFGNVPFPNVLYRALAGDAMVIASRTPGGRPNQCPACGSTITIEPSDPAGDAPCPNCGHLLWFIWEDDGDAVVIKPTASFLRSEDLDTLLNEMSEKIGIRLVLDLSQVQYLSSAVLGRLINLKKKVTAMNGKLKIENLHPDLFEIFRITRLDQAFDIER